MIRKVGLRGVKLHEVDMETTLRLMEALLKSGRPNLLVTLSSEMLLELPRSPEFARVVNSAALVVPDAEGVRVWGSKLGLNLPQRVSGIDILEKFFPRCAQNGFRVFLLGSKPGVADQAAQNLSSRFPGINLAGAADGYFKDDEAMAAKIRNAKTDFLAIGMGSPRQELWFDKYRDKLGVSLAVGVGGSLDVLAGNLPRAPKIFRKIKLEWAYRLLREPSRLKRILPLFGLPWLMLREKPQTPVEDEFLSGLFREEDKR